MSKTSRLRSPSPGRTNGPRPTRMEVLSSLVFVVNIVAGVLVMYSSLNLRPDLPATASWTPAGLPLGRAVPGGTAPDGGQHGVPVAGVAVGAHGLDEAYRDGAVEVPVMIGQRAANAPVTLAVVSLSGWMLVKGALVAWHDAGRADPGAVGTLTHPAGAGRPDRRGRGLLRSRVRVPHPGLACPAGHRPDRRKFRHLEDPPDTPAPSCSGSPSGSCR